MSKVHVDELGLYVAAGGWCARPIGPSTFVAGDDIKTKHFGGSVVCGIGKEEGAARGEYTEYWMTSGIGMYELKDMSAAARKEKWDWYLAHCTGSVWMANERKKLKRERRSQGVIRASAPSVGAPVRVEMVSLADILAGKV